MARPTPIRETSTVNSVTCRTRSRWSCGSRLISSTIGSRPKAIPTPTSTIGGERAIRRVAWGSTVASSRESPSRK
jgi:hypothetical protein